MLGGSLTIGSGIKVKLPDYSTNYIGDSSSFGALRTSHVSGNKPKVERYGENADRFQKFIIEGPIGTPSVINIDGLEMTDNDATSGLFEFQVYYTITNFDNIDIDTQGPTTASVINFVDCTNGTFSDVTWNSINFLDTRSPGYNINLSGTNCNTASSVTIDGTGPGYGATSENDPNNLLNWL